MTLMTSTLADQVPATLIMLGIISAIGSVGNILVLLVYATKQDRLTATVFIIALASVDLFACTCLIPLTIFIESVEWRIQSQFFCKFYYALNNSFIPFSSLMISAIAFDRYCCICHPFMKIVTVLRARRMILALLGLSLVCGSVSTLIVLVTKSTVAVNQTLNATLEYECTEIVHLKTTLIQTIIYRAVQGSQFSSYALCIISVVILYVLIFYSVLKMRRKRARLLGKKAIHIRDTLSSNPPSTIPPTQQSGEIEMRSQDNNEFPETQITPEKQHLTVILSKGRKENYNKIELESYSSNGEQEQSIRQVSACLLSDNSQTALDKSYKYVATRISQNSRKPCDKLSGNVRSQIHRKLSMKTLRETTIFQNMKTAGMLFVVAIVYILTVLPAITMAMDVIPMYLPVFYLYYVNNAINPIIYCFMNPNFRADIRKLFEIRMKLCR